MNRFGTGRKKSDIAVNSTGTGKQTYPTVITKTGKRIDELDIIIRQGKLIGNIVIPMLFTFAPDEILNSSFIGNAEIITVGGELVSQRGFCFVEGRLEIPTTNDGIIFEDGSFTFGEYSKLVFGLAVGKEYTIRSFAINSAGVGYGDIIIIRLQDYETVVIIRDQVIAQKLKELMLERRIKEVATKTKIREVVGLSVNTLKEKLMYTFGDKQPYEEYFVAFNFSRVISPNTEIVSAIVIVYDEDGNDVTEIITEPSEQTIQKTKVAIKIKSGISENTYKITCRIITSNGEKFEMDSELNVIEK